MLAKPRGAHGDHPMRRNEPFLDKTRQVELQIGPDKTKIVIDKLDWLSQCLLFVGKSTKKS